MAATGAIAALKKRKKRKRKASWLRMNACMYRLDSVEDMPKKQLQELLDECVD